MPKELLKSTKDKQVQRRICTIMLVQSSWPFTNDGKKITIVRLQSKETEDGNVHLRINSQHTSLK